MNNPKMLWQPSAAFTDNSNMVRFMNEVNRRHGLSLSTYQELWQWSVDHIADFWGLFWEFAGIIASNPMTRWWTIPARCPGLNGLPAPN
jgi:acetoacetyl-CoA synthetase